MGVLKTIDLGVVRAVFRGNWNAATQYEFLNTVIHNNCMWQAVALNIPVGDEPIPGSQDGMSVSGSWVRLGQPGTPGNPGETGATFTPSVSAAGVISWTNDKGLPNPSPVYIKGPQGAQGPRGLQGEAGPQGPQGEKGEKGEKGDPGSGAVNIGTGDSNILVTTAGDQVTIKLANVVVVDSVVSTVTFFPIDAAGSEYDVVQITNASGTFNPNSISLLTLPGAARFVTIIIDNAIQAAVDTWGVAWRWEGPAPTVLEAGKHILQTMITIEDQMPVAYVLSHKKYLA